MKELASAYARVQPGLTRASQLAGLGFDTGDFTADAAFPFLATAVVILSFGPGALSLDYLICLWRKKERRGPKL